MKITVLTAIMAIVLLAWAGTAAEYVLRVRHIAQLREAPGWQGIFAHNIIASGPGSLTGICLSWMSSLAVVVFSWVAYGLIRSSRKGRTVRPWRAALRLTAAAAVLVASAMSLKFCDHEYSLHSRPELIRGLMGQPLQCIVYQPGVHHDLQASGSVGESLVRAAGDIGHNGPASVLVLLGIAYPVLWTIRKCVKDCLSRRPTRNAGTKPASEVH